jgi:four helix bundle protein
MGDKIISFQDLDVWKYSQDFAVKIYTETKNFPNEERFGLTNQIRRAVVSVSSNIAEGFSRPSYKEKIKFFFIALGSVTEVQSQLLLAQRLNFISEENCKSLIEDSTTIHKLLNGIIKKSREKLDS